MPIDLAYPTGRRRGVSNWKSALLRLAATWIALFSITYPEWGEMAHQWWNIDTYSHILLIPAIIAWLIWLRREELAKLSPQSWWPGLIIAGAGLSVWLAGRATGINLFAHAGTVLAFQGAAITFLGLRTSLILAFPLFYACFLVPFGDEIVPTLQSITASLATTLTVWSGIDSVTDGIYIDTPAGLFIVAEACSGVKFLIAMIALGVMVAYACFESWSRRAWFMLACLVVPIIANGIRAWGTIYIAQYIGAEAAGGFDHIVYGWFFFGIVIALVLGVAWRWFERDPEDAGYSEAEVAQLPIVEGYENLKIGSNVACAIGLIMVIGCGLAASLL